MGLPQEKLGGVNQPEPGQVRRPTREINTDWQYLQKKGPARAANDDGYGQSSKPTIDENYSDTAFNDKMLGPVGLANKQNSQRKAANDEEFQTEDDQPRPSYRRQPLRSPLRNSLAASLVDPQIAIARTKATAINLETIAWQTPLYLTQLTFAVIGIVTLGVVGAIDSATTSTGGFFSWVASKALGAVSAIASFFGVDFMEIALALYLITYMVVLAIGMFSIFTLYMQYTLALMKPLSGTAEGLKWGMLMLTCIGYALPFANMFPFILLWMAAVWLYPK
jgi:hypothetical protein